MAARAKLTEAFCKTAEVGFHRDGAVAGFGLRVGARGKAFEIRIERKGRPNFFDTLGHFPAMSAAAARSAALQAWSDFEAGKSPRQAAPGELTLDLVLPLYIERAEDRGRAEETLNWYKRSINRLSESLRMTPLRELAQKPMLLADELSRMRRRMKGKTPRDGQDAATGSARAISTLFRFAQKRDPSLNGIGDPCSAVDKVSPKRDDLPVLGTDDLAGWWNKVDAIEHGVIKWALLFTVLSGLRRNKVVGIEWRHVDLKRRVVAIPRQKNRKPFELILSRPMLRILWRARYASRQLYKQHADKWVFAGPRGHLHGSTLAHQGVEANHALRRSFGTVGRDAGFPKDMVRVLLGHGEADVTDRYVRTNKLHRLYGAAQEDISRHIVAAMGNPKGLK